MRKEETRKVPHDMCFKKNIAPIREHRTSDFNCRSYYDRNVDRYPDLDDGKIPTDELIPTGEEAWQDESNGLTPPQPTFISRTDGMSFNMAQITSTGKFDDDQSDPLPLGF